MSVTDFVTGTQMYDNKHIMNQRVEGGGLQFRWDHFSMHNS